MTRLSLSAMIFGATVTILAIGGVFIGVYYEGPDVSDASQIDSTVRGSPAQDTAFLLEMGSPGLERSSQLGKSSIEVHDDGEHPAVGSSIVAPVA